jgi:hypothetical protein
MHARIASFEGGNTEELRRLNEERMSSGTMDMPDGITGAMALVDSDSNRRLFITFFDTPEQIEAAEEQFKKMGDEIPEEIRGRRTSVDVYEVVWNQEAAKPVGAASASA